MPGRHVLVCAVEVQGEAGQQTWGQEGQDSVLMAAAFPALQGLGSASWWMRGWKLWGHVGMACSPPLPGCVLAGETLKTNKRGPAEKEGSGQTPCPGGAGRGQANKLLIKEEERRGKNNRALGDLSERGSLPGALDTHLCYRHRPCSLAGASRSHWGSHPRSVWT